VRAITITEPGGPEVLELTEQPDPRPGPGEVLLDVTATAVNRADLLQRQGHYPPPPGTSGIPGLECSGTVSELGEGVEELRAGDPVCALLAGGGYAERVVVPAGQVMPLPSGVDLVTAGGLPEVACTVWSNVVMGAHLAEGELFLVHGGSGGIGTHAIQVGVALGARVATTASGRNLPRCAELGAPRQVPSRGGGRDAGTQRDADLDRVRPDAARPTVHEEQLALGQVRAHYDVRPHRARHLGQPAGGDEVDPGRQRHHLPGRHHDPLRVTPAREQRTHRVAGA